jgi:hypothetical protein
MCFPWRLKELTHQATDKSETGKLVSASATGSEVRRVLANGSRCITLCFLGGCNFGAQA